MLIFVVVFYLYFLMSNNAKLNFLAKFQEDRRTEEVTKCMFGEIEGSKASFGHFQLYSLFSPTMTHKKPAGNHSKTPKKRKSKRSTGQPRVCLYLFFLMLMIAGDVHHNPGPSESSVQTKKHTPKFPCTECEKECDQIAKQFRVIFVTSGLISNVVMCR